MSDQEEKEPIVLDIIREFPHRSPNVVKVIGKEEAERFRSVAEKLGGYSVEVIADSGDLYRTRTIHSTGNQPGDVSSVMEVPEGKVIVSMQNTAYPVAPTDMTPLIDAVREEE